MDWKNTICEDNVRFAEAAGSIITNYWWDHATLEEAKTFATSKASFTESEIGLENIYFGIDCWGQTKDGPGPNNRKTYGTEQASDDLTGGSGKTTGIGHGGTATGLAAMTVAPLGFGVGIFAQAWAYEHFDRAKTVDRFMWEGKPDLEPWKRYTDWGANNDLSPGCEVSYLFALFNFHGR